MEGYFIQLPCILMELDSKARRCASKSLDGYNNGIAFNIIGKGLKRNGSRNPIYIVPWKMDSFASYTFGAAYPATGSAAPIRIRLLNLDPRCCWL